MWLLIVGLILFLGIHAVRIVAPGWREKQIENLGDGPWKGIYSVISLAGLLVIIYGYGMAREAAGQVFDPPSWGRGALLIAMPVSLVLLVASNFKAGYIKRLFGHPLVWAVVIWSAAHLAANGDAVSVVLFAGFLVWAAIDLVSAISRPTVRAAEIVLWPDIVSVIVGLGASVAFMLYLHAWLIGVPVI